MKQFTFLNNLKLRAGYGLSGNQDAIDSYNSLQLVKPNGVVSVGGSPTVTMGVIRNANPDLKWEVKRTVNAGIDVGFFRNRLLMTVDYYHSKTSDMLRKVNCFIKSSSVIIQAAETEGKNPHLLFLPTLEEASARALTVATYFPAYI